MQHTWINLETVDLSALPTPATLSARRQQEEEKTQQAERETQAAADDAASSRPAAAARSASTATWHLTGSFGVARLASSSSSPFHRPSPSTRPRSASSNSHRHNASSSSSSSRPLSAMRLGRSSPTTDLLTRLSAEGESSPLGFPPSLARHLSDPSALARLDLRASVNVGGRSQSLLHCVLRALLYGNVASGMGEAVLRALATGVDRAGFDLAIPHLSDGAALLADAIKLLQHERARLPYEAAWELLYALARQPSCTSIVLNHALSDGCTPYALLASCLPTRACAAREKPPFRTPAHMLRHCGANPNAFPLCALLADGGRDALERLFCFLDPVSDLSTLNLRSAPSCAARLRHCSHSCVLDCVEAQVERGPHETARMAMLQVLRAVDAWQQRCVFADADATQADLEHSSLGSINDRHLDNPSSPPTHAFFAEMLGTQQISASVYELRSRLHSLHARLDQVLLCGTLAADLRAGATRFTSHVRPLLRRLASDSRLRSSVAWNVHEGSFGGQSLLRAMLSLSRSQLREMEFLAPNLLPSLNADPVVSAHARSTTARVQRLSFVERTHFHVEEIPERGACLPRVEGDFAHQLWQGLLCKATKQVEAASGGRSQGCGGVVADAVWRMLIASPDAWHTGATEAEVGNQLAASSGYIADATPASPFELTSAPQPLPSLHLMLSLLSSLHLHHNPVGEDFSFHLLQHGSLAQVGAWLRSGCLNAILWPDHARGSSLLTIADRVGAWYATHGGALGGAGGGSAPKRVYTLPPFFELVDKTRADVEVTRTLVAEAWQAWKAQTLPAMHSLLTQHLIADVSSIVLQFLAPEYKHTSASAARSEPRAEG